jgi:hypothetical protein
VLCIELKVFQPYVTVNSSTPEAENETLGLADEKSHSHDMVQKSNAAQNHGSGVEFMRQGTIQRVQWWKSCVARHRAGP